MALPTLTAAQRRAALAKAVEARAARAALLASLKAGTTTLSAVLAQADNGDEIVKKTTVLAVVKALPGIGEVKARQLLEQVQVAAGRRIGGLGKRQRAALLAATR